MTHDRIPSLVDVWLRMPLDDGKASISAESAWFAKYITSIYVPRKSSPTASITLAASQVGCGGIIAG